MTAPNKAPSALNAATLGLSLIGIGWLYSRYLGGARNLVAAQP